LVFNAVEQFACGWAHITIIKLDKSVESYGRNSLGQLGHQKETNNINFPLQKDEFVHNIISGSEFTFAITSQNRLYGWGWNEHYNIIPTELKILPEPTLIEVPFQICSNIWTNPALTIVDTKQH
jgi:alpha-tubulin suppressor-like RCC1 family protein